MLAMGQTDMAGRLLLEYSAIVSSLSAKFTHMSTECGTSSSVAYSFTHNRLKKKKSNGVARSREPVS